MRLWKIVFFICTAVVLSECVQIAIKANRQIKESACIYVVNKDTGFVMLESRYLKLCKVHYRIVDQQVICEWITPERKEMTYPMSDNIRIVQSDTEMPRWMPITKD